MGENQFEREQRKPNRLLVDVDQSPELEKLAKDYYGTDMRVITAEQRRQALRYTVPVTSPGDCTQSRKYELVQVDRADLVSGERTRICWKGDDAVFHGDDCFVLEPAHDWRLGWFLDEPNPDRGNVAAVVRAGLDHRGGVSEFAVTGLLVMSVYALQGAFRLVEPDEAAAAVEAVLTQLDTNPCNIDGVGYINVPLGFSLQVLDAGRLDFWRRQPRPTAAAESSG